MLSYEQIKSYFPEHLSRINPKGIITEYLQHEYLDSFYKLKGSEKLSFIGGTAIRLIYNSQRFSEDLDFDNFAVDFKGFKELVERTVGELEAKGFNTKQRFLSKGDVFHCYIIFPSIFQDYGLQAHHQQSILVSIDCEKKKKLFVPDVKTINKFGIFRNINVNPAKILLSQKMIAILKRKREKGRDFYDVSFLSGLTSPDFEYIKAVMGMEKEDFINKFVKRCSEINYKSLAKDISPFLFDPVQQNRVLEFTKTVISPLMRI